MKFIYALKRVAFVTYILFVVFLLIINRGVRLTIMPYWDCITTGINIVPLRSFVDYFRIGAVNWKVSVSYFVSNIALFIPFGVLAPLMFTNLRKYSILIKWSLLFRLIIELAQLLSTRGIFDIDDFILSYAGVTIGYLLRRAFIAVWSNKHTKSTTASNLLECYTDNHDNS